MKKFTYRLQGPLHLKNETRNVNKNAFSEVKRDQNKNKRILSPS